MFNWIMFVIVFVHYKKEIGIDLESNIFLVSGIDKKETIAKDFSLKKTNLYNQFTALKTSVTGM